VQHIHDSYHTFLDGYCSTVQGLLDWFEVDLEFTELLLCDITHPYDVVDESRNISTTRITQCDV